MTIHVIVSQHVFHLGRHLGHLLGILGKYSFLAKLQPLHHFIVHDSLGMDGSPSASLEWNRILNTGCNSFDLL